MKAAAMVVIVAGGVLVALARANGAPATTPTLTDTGTTAVEGTWGTAQEVPGTAALNTGGYASQFGAVRCRGQLRR